jgi:hypothetical protein
VDKGDHGFKKVPRGATGGGYRRPRVQVGFSDAVIKLIVESAKKNDRSFAAEVRALVAIGLKIKNPGLTR